MHSSHQDEQDRRRTLRERGQSTVEYVGLAVAVAVLLVAIGGGMSGHGDKLGGAVAKRLQDAISSTK
jgi:Flp pilus assembly pilin Flp